MSNLRRERDEMLTQQQHDSTTDAAHIRSVQRENVQLNVKLKSLLTELEEIRSQREHAGMQADNVTRLQVKQLAELSAAVKALEVWSPGLLVSVVDSIVVVAAVGVVVVVKISYRHRVSDVRFSVLYYYIFIFYIFRTR